MDKSISNRVLYSVLIVLAIISTYTIVFSWAMQFFENQQVSYAQALQVVVESLTTSGYGGFSPWQSDFLNIFVVTMNITGVALVFFAFPILIVPILKRALEKTPPKKVFKTDHVVICTYSNHAEVLIQELNSRGKDYIIIEPDKEKALDLLNSGLNVITGKPEVESVLLNACVDSASALILNSSIEKSISTILTVKHFSSQVNIIAVLIKTEEKIYYKLAGAGTTILPRQLIGESLAKQVPAISILDSVEIDNNIDVIEIDIEEGSDLCNKSVRSSELLDNHRVNIIGAWQKDEFFSPVSPDLILNSKIRLLVAGEKEEIENLNKKAESTTRHFRRNKVFVLGYGQAGYAAVKFLENRSVDVNVIDINQHEGVDFVGDISRPETLREAGIEEATSVIITIHDDTKAVYATLMTRNMNKDAHIAVRANNRENIRKLFDAGADYVQAVTTVSGRMLAAAVFEDEDSIAAEKQINLLQLPAGRLAGSTLNQSDVRAETGCTILMAVRNGKNVVYPDPASFVFEENDQLIVAGNDESVYKFEEKYLSR